MIVLKRRNILVLSLVLLLVITGYINHRYNQHLGDQKAAEGQVDQEVDQENQGKQEQKDVEGKVNIKDDFVDVDTDTEITTSQSNMNFFVEYRLERDQTRSEEVDLLKGIVEDENSSQDTIKEAQQKIMNIVERTEQEMTVENLLKAQGFDDAVAMIHDESINIIVSEQNLTDDKVAQIQNIVINETDFEIPQIKIIEKR